MAKVMAQLETPALSVHHLSVYYDDTPVLWDINFEVPVGNIVGIIGPNGAGKSTLIKSILQMTDCLSGKISFLGTTLKRKRKKIAYVPQRSTVDWDFPISVLEVVLMGLYPQKNFFSWIGDQDKKKAYQVLESVGMRSFADRQISQLSGGQQQRVFLARALLQDADIYFMDEPFAGVDIATEHSLMLTIKGLKEKKKTLFIVHHDLNTVRSYFDWVVLLNKGLIGCGPIEEVFTEENITRAYGKEGKTLFDVNKLFK
ncbi:MAG: metal ABC transporter ATP-binding protein [Chlamydiae bacterium]|nr:metal ABC transporter ATP-binding protein [Chlamydiota bacterium]